VDHSEVDRLESKMSSELEITFKSDTSYRKDFFVPESFSHPAKMVAPLLLWIVNKYTQPGETILDPMAGSGTMMLACPLGRNVVMLELEQKFVRMQVDNWQKVKQMPQLGYSMGECTILQGDARNLEGLCDSVITSPPYAENKSAITDKDWLREHQDELSMRSPSRHGAHQRENQHHERLIIPDNPSNIGNLKYGEIDAVVSSPPYEQHHQGGEDLHSDRMEGGQSGSTSRRYDAVVTSPPYENQVHRNSDAGKEEELKALGPSHYVDSSQPVAAARYDPSEGNIGNLKSASYLEAMLQVYGQCHKVLRDGGIMVLVTKDFIRDQKRIDLAGDTIKLCEEAGFTFLERHYRKLTSVSFWRTIYKQKYPDAPEINTEDILVFRK